MIGIDVTRGCDDECVRKLDGAMSSTNSGRQHGDLEVQRLDIDGDALDAATAAGPRRDGPTKTSANADAGSTKRSLRDRASSRAACASR